MIENEISGIIIDAGLKVHKKLGTGLYESVYEQCLEYELKNRGLSVQRQKFLKISYENLIVENAFKIDLLVENKVVVELKALEKKKFISFCPTLKLFKTRKF